MTDKPPGFFKRCGIGKGADCCIFLIVGRNGFECARDTSGHDTLVLRKHQGMVAQREPTEPFPGCQLAIPAESEA